MMPSELKRVEELVPLYAIVDRLRSYDVQHANKRTQVARKGILKTLAELEKEIGVTRVRLSGKG